MRSRLLISRTLWRLFYAVVVVLAASVVVAGVGGRVGHHGRARCARRLGGR